MDETTKPTQSEAQPQRTVVLSESLDLTEAQIDHENRVIKQVVLIRAGMSKNRRFYGEQTLKEAVAVFEGAKAYANHPSKDEQKNRPERSIRDITGWYSGVHYHEGAIRADRYFSRTQAGNDAWAIAEDIVSKRAPATLAGLSINAVGSGAPRKFDDGEALEVTAITAANSVDDVSIPAAGGGYTLTASDGGDEITSGILETLNYQEWLQARPEFTERLKREWKQVRLEEATKTALAEADQKVKAAEVDTRQAQQALTESEKQRAQLEAVNEKLVTEVQSLRLKLAVNEALENVHLPAVYLNDLRERLPKAPTGEWASMIETELLKVKRSNTSKVPVTHASVNELKPDNIATSIEEVVMPRDNEDVKQWRERIGRFNQMMKR